MRSLALFQISFPRLILAGVMVDDGGHAADSDIATVWVVRQRHHVRGPVQGVVLRGHGPPAPTLS